MSLEKIHFGGKMRKVHSGKTCLEKTDGAINSISRAGVTNYNFP